MLTAHFLRPKGTNPFYLIRSANLPETKEILPSRKDAVKGRSTSYQHC